MQMEHITNQRKREEKEMFCGKGGKENKEGAMFCAGCGAPLSGKRQTSDTTAQPDKEERRVDRISNDDNSGNVNNITISMGESVKQHTHGSGEGEGMAIAAMILGIVSLVSSCCFYYVSIPCAVVSVVLAAVTLKSKRNGRGMAIAGLVCAIISLVPAIIMISTGAAIISAF